MEKNAALDCLSFEEIDCLSSLDGLVCAFVSQVPLMNGQMCPPVRPPMSCGQPAMARHPSREQLIDYLMLKVSQQPPGPPRVPHETLQQEVGTSLKEISIF